MFYIFAQLLQSNRVIHSDSDVLLASQVAFGSLYGGVPKQELDLLQVAAGLATELMGWSAALTLLH